MLAVVQPFSGILHSLHVGAVFFYKALWSILFGVSVTAAVDIFVDKERMARFLGRRNAATTAKAAALGAASSSCTFGAVSIAQSIFKKGASAESTFSFALASTNIVFELGILIYILLGWQYLVAELASGVLLVVIVYVIARATLPTRVFEEARRRLQEQDGEAAGPQASQAAVAVVPTRPPTLRQQLSEPDVWYRLAQRYFKTIGRIYKSVVFGFLIAGFIVALVPKVFWMTLFLSPATFPGALENTAAGVAAGVFSFIGSIGIVPFAAALWLGGVSFGGGVGAIVSDLITVPVLNVWRSFMGWRATAYIAGVFFFAMVASAILMEEAFKALHALPARPATSHALLHVSLSVNFTLIMTVVFLAVAVWLYAMKRRGDRRGGASARDASDASSAASGADIPAKLGLDLPSTGSGNDRPRGGQEEATP